MQNIQRQVLYFPSGSDWFSIHWRHHDSAAAGRLDPPPGPTRCRLFSHQGGPVDQLGRRPEGVWANPVYNATVDQVKTRNLLRLLLTFCPLPLKVFEELLLDGDWALNAGNWQWLSASTFFHQFFRVYSPVAFGKKTDKNGDYIK